MVPFPPELCVADTARLARVLEGSPDREPKLYAPPRRGLAAARQVLTDDGDYRSAWTL